MSQIGEIRRKCRSNKMRPHSKRNRINNFLWPSLVLVLLCFPPLTFAGGVVIDKQSIAFDNDRAKRQFEPNTEIVLTYNYEDFAYSGKAHAFIVFELRGMADQGASSQVYFFTTEIH